MNDYNQHYVNTGERPQNTIADHTPGDRFKEYPQLEQLVKQKDELLSVRNHPPFQIKQDVRDISWDQIGQFDVILIDPPWMEYKNRMLQAKEQLGSGGQTHSIHNIFDEDDERFEGWSTEDISMLQIDKISKTPSFLFLWVGSEHLDDGRNLFKKWGFKRCEDIVWLKTNKSHPSYVPPNPKHLLQRVKEHCLVGVKGDVKRASDSHFIHANIDTDVIVSEEPPIGDLEKPSEIYDVIERFCLGRRRLQLFSNSKRVRKGWVVISKSVMDSRFPWDEYNTWLTGTPDMRSYNGGETIGTTTEIEDKRPKSPKKSQPNH